MEKIKVFILSSSKEKTDLIAQTLGKSLDIGVVGSAFPERSAFEALPQAAPDVVVMTAEGTDETILSAAQRIYVTMPGCPIMLLYDQQPPEFLQKAVRAGVRNLVRLPCEPRELLENIRYLYHLEEARQTSSPQAGLQWQSQVITIFGTKGGIGKTTIAVNLAAALARLRKKVAIIDLDLQFGDVGVFLDMETKDTLSELVQENNINMEKISTYLMLHASGVSVLCAPRSPEYAETVGASHVEKILSSIRSYYDYVIVDTGPIFTDPTITALEHSNVILFPLTLDVSTLRNAKISMGILNSLGQKDKVQVVVNRETKSIISLKDAERILGMQVMEHIPSDWDTATNALNKGMPFVLDRPNAKISQGIYSLARKISSAK